MSWCLMFSDGRSHLPTFLFFSFFLFFLITATSPRHNQWGTSQRTEMSTGWRCCWRMGCRLMAPTKWMQWEWTSETLRRSDGAHCWPPHTASLHRDRARSLSREDFLPVWGFFYSYLFVSLQSCVWADLSNCYSLLQDTSGKLFSYIFVTQLS